MQKDVIFEEIESYVLQACKLNQQEKQKSQEIRENFASIKESKEKELSDVLGEKLRKLMQTRRNNMS